MTEKSEFVQSDDVLSFEEEQGKEIVIFIEDIINTLGIPCQMMTPRRQGWMKGKVKLSLKFIPDEVNKTENSQVTFSSESPLDEIRNISI
jgi:hypothetical protein